jgi:hypothetical protein
MDQMFLKHVHEVLKDCKTDDLRVLYVQTYVKNVLETLEKREENVVQA